MRRALMLAASNLTFFMGQARGSAADSRTVPLGHNVSSNYGCERNYL